MFVHEIAFFKGTGHLFAQNIMKISQQRSFEASSFIFKEGDPARFLYILMEGRIRLSIGQTGLVVYIASHGGEAFGWSSLMGRPSYSATAETLLPARLLAFERGRLMQIIERDPRNGFILFKGLAMTLGNRLIQSYGVLSDASLFAGSPSEGSGQFQTCDEMT
jgi:CRP-like cAMP-binding protein